ncbi:homeobox-leucine zipper protein GLABRA 2, partial [Dioscorea cayenensis subsp. rotundata]|uniref:Homeobox-leucine zipper protein GLABRA 2 n=1 Tax=Dioscorea cayennensis subsp. rotundata TaxID=55577 RepID=A0AB40AT15_DIOCR
AGVFRNVKEKTVEDGEEENGVEKSSSENNGGAWQSEDDVVEVDEDGEVGNGKKRKKYHRHTADQIRVMEGLFKDSPHPDEKQREQLSKQLGLAPRQVKFWFQNRRTQIKALQERHENSLLKTEMEKLQEENKSLREMIKKACCPNCGLAISSKDTVMTSEEQQLRIENARLKAEVKELTEVKNGTPRHSLSMMASADEIVNPISMDCHSGFFGLEKSMMLETLEHALEELIKMATLQEPMWIRSFETGREILNYDEYIQEFSPKISSNGNVRKRIEASRESGIVFLDISSLLKAFMDAKKWKEMFPFMISKAATMYVIFNGENGNINGSAQLMFTELQMVTPMVPTREIYFVRYCKKLSNNRWAILDVSIDEIEDNIDVSLMKCRKRPSGCIIEEKPNGHCMVTWVEHMECQKGPIPSIYRSIISTGLAFGAHHWMATLQLQCERIVFFMATNVPTKDSNGVSNIAGRRSILKLAQRMTSSFCEAIGSSKCRSWTKASTKNHEEIFYTSRKNNNEPGEPLGLILCSVSSTWLPISPTTLYNFLREDSRRDDWDVMLFGGPTKTIANIAKGQDHGNMVTIHARSEENNSNPWVVQDSCKNSFEFMIVYSPVDVACMHAVMNGCDSNNIAILPCGFSIIPDNMGTRPLVITSKPEEKAIEEGSLLTIAFQMVASSSPSMEMSMGSLETINNLVSCTLGNIKEAMNYVDE